jgi:hypothetical protein
MLKNTMEKWENRLSGEGAVAKVESNAIFNIKSAKKGK